MAALAACEPTPAAVPGETEEWRQWRAGLFGQELTADVKGGVGTVPLTISFSGFPTYKNNDHWIEMAVNGRIVQRYNLCSPTGRGLVLQYSAQVRQGLLSVKLFDTATNRSWSSGTVNTQNGTRITVVKSGQSIDVQQIPAPRQ